MNQVKRMNSPTAQQRILSLLNDDVRPWETLKTLGKINDEGLGFTIGELLGLRKMLDGDLEDRGK